MSPGEVEALFTREDGTYLFARWGRPIAPVVFGVDDASLAVIKGALEAVVVLAGHSMAETDPELGSNFMMFYFRDWSELPEVDGLDRLVPDLVPLVARLEQEQASQYRIFRFDESGAIKACFVFLRMDGEMGAVPVETLALGQVVQSALLWSERAFRDRSPLAMAGSRTILRPDIAAVIRAGYDPVLPDASSDASHALRLSARVGMNR